MCGLAGIFHQSFSPERADVEHMLNIIQHRGPDGRDLYINADICLGIVRLAMLDSENDTSILSNETNTIYLAYNGEIYNHQILRNILKAKGHEFKTKNDGEVIIHLYEEKSFNFVKEMDGMFAFALWDSDKKILCLGRDALGIKPLYFKRKDNKIFFASELKAIVTLEKQFPEINPIGLSSYFNYRFIVAPYTIFKNMAKLEPGTLLIAKEGEIEIKKYWEPTFNIKNKKADFFPMLLHSTIQSTAAADFPLGVFLSGGLDSSTILASLSDKLPLLSFTVGYDFSTYMDERQEASIIASHLQSKHYHTCVNSNDISRILNKVIWHLDEPIYSTVSLSTYALAELAAQHVKGVLTGDGSDELFMSYHYLQKPFEAIKNKMDWKLAYQEQIGWLPMDWKKILLVDPFQVNQFNFIQDKDTVEVNALRYFELRYRLPEYHLARVDRLCMAHGLEARVPFLRRKIVKYILGEEIKNYQKIDNRKYLLRNIITNYLPNKFIQLNKKPFTAPFEEWLKVSLKEEIYEIILGTNYHLTLGLNITGLMKLIKKCYAGENHLFPILWGIFNLYKWYFLYFE